MVLVMALDLAQLAYLQQVALEAKESKSAL